MLVTSYPTETFDATGLSEYKLAIPEDASPVYK